MEAYSWSGYFHWKTVLISGYFGIEPPATRRLRGFSLTSVAEQEPGYSLASQGGMNNEDIEMMERT